jgi:hypothetical protein
VKTNNRLVFFFFYIILSFILTFHLLFSQCYYSNYYDNINFRIYCANFRDIPVTKLNLSNLYLSNVYETIKIDRLLFAKKDNKNILLGIKKREDAILDLFEFNPIKKRFEYRGSYYRGFVSDLNNDGSYEVIYLKKNNNKIYIERNNEILNFNLSHNESLFFVMGNFIFTLKNLSSNEYNYSLNIYKLSNNQLQEKYSINLTSEDFNSLSKFFVYSDSIFANYKDDWYLINNDNISKWKPVYFYQRDSLSKVDLEKTAKFYLNVPSYSFFESFSNDPNLDPIFSIVKNYNIDNVKKDLLFVLYGYPNLNYLDVYDLKNSKLIKSYNVSFFQAYRDRVFFSKGSGLFYTTNFYDKHLLLNLSKYFDSSDYDLNIREFYFFDLDNDGFDELIILTKDVIAIFDNTEEPKVDYYVKKVEFPNPYTTYRTFFNFTVCSKGNQIVPFNISVTVFHNKTKLKNNYFFENVFLNSDSCKTFKINYISYKKGNITISIKLEVKDENLKNNNYTVTKQVISDFYSLNESLSSFRKNKNDFILFIDKNDDLSDGYETIIINTSRLKLNNLEETEENSENSDENVEETNDEYKTCNYKKIDYNNDNISEYLLDCFFYKYYLTADPLNLRLINTSYLKGDDFEFYVGLFGNNYTVILPWNKYKGYIDTLKKDQNDVDIILVDYNLDGKPDFLIYPWALDKEILDYKMIGKNLKINNLVSNTYYDPESNRLIKDLNVEVLYKGLFNNSEKIPVDILGNRVFIEVSESSNSSYFIPISNVPYSDYNSLNINYQIRDNIKKGEVKILYNDFIPWDNNITVNLCRLSIKKINLEPDNSYVEINKSCEDNVILEIYSKGELIYSNESNDTVFYLNNSVLEKEMTFVVYYPNKLEAEYGDNIRKVSFDLNKLIQVEFLNTDFTLFVKNKLNFNVICKKGINLNLSFECRGINVSLKKSFLCEGENNFSLDVLFDKKTFCILVLKNPEENINLKFRAPLKFKVPKEIKRIKIKDKHVIILEIDGEKKAFITNEKKLVDVCEKKISKEQFEGTIELDNGCLNIVEVEVPNFLKVLEVNTTGVALKQSNKFYIYTFDNKITFKTEAITPINESLKKKYNAISNKQADKMVFLKKLALFLSFGSFLAFLGLAGSYYFYLYQKRRKMELRKLKIQELQKIKRMKEEEKKKKAMEILKMKEEQFLEEEARKLLSWIKFLLTTYDENEIKGYLIKKGYHKEVVEKAFELYKKERGLK